MVRVMRSQLSSIGILFIASFAFAVIVISTKMAYANVGWSCGVGGGNGCVADIGLFSVSCGGATGGCVECVNACAKDTTPTAACTIGTNSGTCGAVSHTCNQGVTTSTCGCIPIICGCELLGCFQGPCMGASSNGSYQFSCVGV